MVTKPRPEFYSLRPVKAALVDRLGAAGAAASFAEMAGYATGWNVATLRVTSLQDYARTNGSAYEEIAPSREIRLPSPPVLGEPREPPIAAITRAFVFCSLEDMVVSSKSNFLLSVDRGEAVLDYQFDELERIPPNLDVDPVVFAPRSGEVTAIIGRPDRELDRALPLVGVHTYNFGHWLLEFLPRLFGCVGRPGFESLPILIDEQMPSQHREALELFVGSTHPIVVLRARETVRVRELWTCSTPTYFPVGATEDAIFSIDGDAFAELLAEVQPRLESVEQSGGPRRIYLLRQDTQHRRLVNRVDVERWFAEHDFEVYDPAALSFSEQLARIRGAAVIAAPEGSAPWLSFFARPGTAIGFLNNPFLDEYWFVTELCRSLGHHLAVLTGDVVVEHPLYPRFSDYTIDVERLPAFLDELARPN